MDGLKNLIFISYKNTWNLQKSLGSLIKWIYNFGAHLLLLYKKEKYQCEELVKELKTEPPTDQKKIKLKLWPIYPFSIIRLVPDDNPRDAFWQENHKCFTLMCDPLYLLPVRCLLQRRPSNEQKVNFGWKSRLHPGGIVAS